MPLKRVEGEYHHSMAPQFGYARLNPHTQIDPRPINGAKARRAQSKIISMYNIHISIVQTLFQLKPEHIKVRLLIIISTQKL